MEPTKLCARCGRSDTDQTHTDWVAAMQDHGSDEFLETDDCHDFIENVEPRKIDITDLIRIGHLVSTMAGTDGFCPMCDIDKNGGCHEFYCACFGLDPKITYDDLEEAVEEVVDSFFDDGSCDDPSCENCGVELDQPVKKPDLN